MRLQADEAVDDVHARLLRACGPVRCSPARRSALSARRARRPACPSFGRLHERLDDAGFVAAGAVQGLLDREHVRVARGLVDERLDRRGERVVRVVHAARRRCAWPQKTSHGRRRRASGGGVCGVHGSYLSSGRSSAYRSQSPLEVERTVDDRYTSFAPSSSSRHSSSRTSGDIVGVDLEAHRPAELRALAQHRSRSPRAGPRPRPRARSRRRA